MKKAIVSFYIYFLTQGSIGLIFGYLLNKNIVMTDKGLVQGKLEFTTVRSYKYVSFKGIPYAKAPIGKLRFKPPVEVDPWQSTFVANKDNIECVQKDKITFLWSGVEDCLVLNVYTPELDLTKPQSDLRTVLVWFHGGAFKSGSGSYQIYGPDHFMEENVVLVSCNYRLGPFGFMTLNHPDAVGNNGLKDQNLVLKWVKRNIKNFGGNPNNVVIFGESAGATSVDFHVLSDMSKGLFQRSISMSGSPFCPWSFMTPYKSEKQAFRLGKLLNNNTAVANKDQLLQILYSKSAVDIMKVTEDMSAYIPAFVPSIEDQNIAPNEEKFMTQCYLSRYVSGEYSKLPHLMGFTSNEALIFSKALDNFLDMEKKLIRQLYNLNNDYPLISIVMDFLVNFGVFLFNTSIEATYEFLHMISDVIFYIGIDMKQRIMTKTNNSNIYYYRISYDGRKNSFHKQYLGLHILQGTSHVDDVFYLFYPRAVNIKLILGSEFQIFVERIVRLWCNFAKYSNPTPHGSNDSVIHITWLPFDTSGKYLEIGNKLTIKHKRPVDASVDAYENKNLEKIIHSKGCVDKSFLSSVMIYPQRPTEVLFNILYYLIVNC